MRAYRRCAVQAVALGACLAMAAALGGCGSRPDLTMKMNPGDRFEVATDRDVSTSTDVMGMSQRDSQRTGETMLFEVKSVDAEGWATIEATIQRLETPGLEGLGPMAEGLNIEEVLSLEGRTFTLVMSPKGKVSSVTGMDRAAAEAGDALVTAVKDVMGKQMEQLPEAMRGMEQLLTGEIDVVVRKGVRDQLGDEAIRERLESVFAVYPEDPTVAKGAVWERTLSLFKGQPMVLNDTFTLEEVKDGVARIAVASQVSPNTAAEPMSLMGMEMKMELSGSRTGTIEIDTETGWITSRTMESDLNGNVSVMGMQATMKVTGTERVVVTRL